MHKALFASGGGIRRDSPLTKAVRTRPLRMALGALLLVQACTKWEVVAVEIGEVTLHPGTASLIDGQTLQFSATVTDADGSLLPAATVTWATDDPGVVAIDAEGFLQALGEGTATVHASFRGVEGTASVAVFPGPTLLVAEDSVALTAVLGVSPPPVVIELSAAGLGTLGGLRASVDYAVGQPDGWLTPTLGATTAPTTLTLTAETSGLPVGGYNATVVVDSDGDEPVLVQVSLAVTGLTVEESGGSTLVTEAGGTDSLTIVLSSAPASDVVVDVTSADVTEVTVAPERLTFTPFSWNVPRVVTLVGPDDPIVDGDVTTPVTVSVVDALSDPAYAAIPDRTILVTTLDDDRGTFTVQETGGSTRASEGKHDEVRVVLDAQPTSDVVIEVWSDDPSEVAVEPVALTFTPGDWADRHVVVVTAVKDKVKDGVHATNVNFAVNDELSDDAFDAAPNQVVSVVTHD